MFTKKELHQSPDYLLDVHQNNIYRLIEAYRVKQGFNRTQLAQKLGVSKGYVSQLLNGGFNHSLLNLIELALKVGKVPVLSFEDLDSVIELKEKGKVIQLNAHNTSKYDYKEVNHQVQGYV